MSRIIRRLQYLLRRHDLEAELREEIECHRSMAQDDLERSGLSPEEAAAHSRRALGNITLAREDARDVWRWMSVEQIWRDARMASRLLRAQPLFTITGLVTLAIGVGAAITVASIVSSELWRPLPFDKPSQLVAVQTTGPAVAATADPVSVQDFLEWGRQTRTIGALAAWRWSSRQVLRGDAAESVTVLPVTANFFDVLRRAPTLGRSFTASDEPSRPVMLSDRGWRRLFSGDPEVVGRSVILNDRACTIVGVTGAAALEFIVDPDLFQVIDLHAGGQNDRRARDLVAMGRLLPGVSVASASAELAAIAQGLAASYPESNANRSAKVVDLRAAFTGWNWRPLTLFLAGALVVLALSCVNVANLLLTRAIGRRREFAIRTALGGGRAAVLRQLLVEGAFLAVPGTALGVLLASWMIPALAAMLPAAFATRGTDFSLDVRVLLCAAGTSIGATMIFAIAPMFLANRRDVSAALVDGGRTVAGSRSERRARHALVVSEITLALVLLAGAGLFLNSFMQLSRLPIGFDAANRLMLRVPLAGERYSADAQLAAFVDALLGDVRGLPGVLGAAIASSGPLESGSSTFFLVQGRPAAAPGSEARAIFRSVSPRFFQTLGIRRVAGRDVTDLDTAGGRRIAIINEHLARRFFPGESPIGRTLLLLPGAGARWIGQGPVEIVGVVSNVKDVGFNEVDFNNIYVPFAQNPAPAIGVYAHTAVPPTDVAPLVRQAVARLDKNLPVIGVQAMEQRVSNALRGDRFNLLLVSSFAGLATLLAAVGIFGAMASSMAQRRQEFGLRMALGADRRSVLALALAQALRLATAGATLGVLIVLIAARVLGDALYVVQGQHEGVVYGARLADPVTLAAAAIAILFVAAAAGLVPARRATNVSPVIALRPQ